MRATPWATAVGERVATLRQERGLSQDELARKLVELGLPWTRATVASIEIGRREITLRETHVLAFAFDEAVSELEPRRGSVALTDGLTVPARTLSTQLDAPAVLPRRKRTGGASATRRRIDEETEEIARLWPQARIDSLAILYIRTDARAEATLVVARKVGATPIEVATTAYQLWSMGLSQKRDRAVETRAPAKASTESIRRIRGHVTRALVKELEPAIEELRSKSKKRRGK